MKTATQVIGLALLATCLLGCRGGSGEMSLARPDVSSVQYSTMIDDHHGCTASMIPIGSNLALTTRHTLTQPVISINSELSGVDVIDAGKGDSSLNDWAIVRVNDIKFEDSVQLDRGYTPNSGDKLIVVGAHGSTFAAVVIECPFVPCSAREMITYKIQGNPNLAGFSGSPLVKQDRDGHWWVVGMHAATLDLLPGWRVYLAIPLQGQLLNSVAKATQRS